MQETHVCVEDRGGAVIRGVKVPCTPADIKTALAGAPACRRVVFETGRMAPMLHHGLTGCGVPVICIESRQARQALKSFATHKTDRNDARYPLFAQSGTRLGHVSITLSFLFSFSAPMSPYPDG